MDMQFRDTTDDGDFAFFNSTGSDTIDIAGAIGVSGTVTTGTVMRGEAAEAGFDYGELGVSGTGTATAVGLSEPEPPTVRVAFISANSIGVSGTGVAVAVVPGSSGGGGGGEDPPPVPGDYEAFKTAFMNELIPVKGGYRTLESVLAELSNEMSPYSEVTKTKLQAPVPRLSSFDLPYPHGTDKDTDWMADGHELFDQAGTIYEFETQFAITYLPFFILVTSLADRTFQYGETITLHLMRKTTGATVVVPH